MSSAPFFVCVFQALDLHTGTCLPSLPPSLPFVISTLGVRSIDGKSTAEHGVLRTWHSVPYLNKKKSICLDSMIASSIPVCGAFIMTLPSSGTGCAKGWAQFSYPSLLLLVPGFQFVFFPPFFFPLPALLHAPLQGLLEATASGHGESIPSSPPPPLLRVAFVTCPSSSSSARAHRTLSPVSPAE